LRKWWEEHWDTQVVDRQRKASAVRTALARNEFIRQVKLHRIAVAAQTKDIALADKKLYAHRD
jgi:thymidine phosphorylase